jgi:hypothetical protein
MKSRVYHILQSIFSQGIELSSLMTKGDKTLLIAALALGFASLGISRLARPIGSEIVVQVNGKIVARMNLSQNQQMEITGARGAMLIQVAQGRVRVVSSNCPEKICVKTGAIHRAGDTIVCVPNRVVIRITGSGQANLNLITG